jgi:hypothetical protein
MNAAVPSDSCPAYPVRMLSPIAASVRIRNGIRMPGNHVRRGEERHGDERDDEDRRYRNAVLPDRKDRGVRLVRRLELACFAIEHRLGDPLVRCGE